MTMKSRILDALMPPDGKLPGDWINMRTLNDICFAYSQRIGDLRKLGYLTETRRFEDGVWYYRLTGFPPKQIEIFPVVPPTESRGTVFDPCVPFPGDRLPYASLSANAVPKPGADETTAPDQNERMK